MRPGPPSIGEKKTVCKAAEALLRGCEVVTGAFLGALAAWASGAEKENGAPRPPAFRPALAPGLDPAVFRPNEERRSLFAGRAFGFLCPPQVGVFRPFPVHNGWVSLRRDPSAAW